MNDYFQFKERVYFYLDQKLSQFNQSYSNKFEVLFSFEKEAQVKLRQVVESKAKIEFAYDDYKAEWLSF